MNRQINVENVSRTQATLTVCSAQRPFILKFKIYILPEVGQNGKSFVWSSALVTGASAGIGFAVTKQLAQLGMKVVGCARNIEKIQVGLACLLWARACES